VLDVPRGVGDGTNANLLDGGAQRAGPERVSVGPGQQCLTEPVGEHAGQALQQQQPGPAQNRRECVHATLRAQRLQNMFDDMAGDRLGQLAQPGAQDADEIENTLGGEAGADGMSHKCEQRGAADQDMLCPVWLEETDRLGVPQRGGGQSRHPALELGPGEAQRCLVQRGRTQVDPEHSGEAAAGATSLEEIPDGSERVAAPLEPADGGQPLKVNLAIYADTAAATGRRHEAQRLVLADGADRKTRPPGELIDGQLHRLHSLGIAHHPWTLPVKTVTVNTVTMTDELSERLLAVLRTATGNPCLEFAAQPEPLTGGFWAELLAFRLAGAQGCFGGNLVARVMPDPALARKETLVQAEVARRGFPTPKVRAAGGPEDGLGRAFMVMDRAPGAPLLADLGGTRAVTQLPRLAATIPETLAFTMSELHRLDPGPLRSQLDAGLAVAVTVAGLLEQLRTSSQSYGRADLVGAARWLAANPPPAAPEVICHGDLHPFNLLVDPQGAATVLDWSAALFGPRAYDVAFTSVVLADPPLLMPAPLRPVARAAGRMLSRRFKHRYRHHSGIIIGQGSLRWHQAVVRLRALAEVAGWDARERAQRRTHPWLVSGPAFAARLSQLTGVRVRPH